MHSTAATSPPPAPVPGSGGTYLPDLAVPVNDAAPEGAGRRGLCIGCDYPLRDLPAGRCPECGREFDPAVASTMNLGRPLGWWGRLVLRPVGWPTIVAGILPMMLVLWAATDPQLYYMAAQYILCFFALLAAGAVTLVRLAPKWAIEARLRIPSNDGRRWRWFWGTLAAGVLLVILKAPMRLAFLASRPAFEQLARQVTANPAAFRPGSRVGLYTVQDVTDYGGGVLLIQTSIHGGGFRYSPAGPDYFGYNPGDEGHVWGAWYWFSTD